MLSSGTRIAAVPPAPAEAVWGAEAVAAVAAVAVGTNRTEGGDNRCRWVQEEDAAWAEAEGDSILVRLRRADARTADTPSHTSQVFRASIRHVRNAEQEWWVCDLPFWYFLKLNK